MVGKRRAAGSGGIAGGGKFSEEYKRAWPWPALFFEKARKEREKNSRAALFGSSGADGPEIRKSISGTLRKPDQLAKSSESRATSKPWDGAASEWMPCSVVSILIAIIVVAAAGRAARKPVRKKAATSGKCGPEADTRCRVGPRTRKFSTRARVSVG